MSDASAGPSTCKRAIWPIMALLLLSALGTACRPAPTPLPPTATAVPTPTVKKGPATLRINVRPDGAGVLLDGRVQGRSPVTLTLQAGTYALLIEQEGFRALTETLQLEPGGEAMIAGALTDIEPPQVSIRLSPQEAVVGQAMSIAVQASDNVSVRQLELLVDGDSLEQLTTPQGPMQAMEVTWTPEAAGVHQLAVRASDAGGNTTERTETISVVDAPSPSPTRVPTPTVARPTPSAGTPSPTPKAAQAITATVSVDTLNVRSGPGRQFARVGILLRGAHLSVLGGNSDASWLLIRDPEGQEGWVSCAFVAVSAPLESVPLVAEIPTSPPATPVSSAGSSVSASETSISILTYPYDAYVRRQVDTAHGNVPLLVLDRLSYEAANPLPEPRQYRLVVLENEFLRLTILPEVGGRIYECIFKPTGHNLLYRNPVIKPTRWGPPEPDGAAWWLAAGGVEWALPVEEHGYEWALPWAYTLTPGKDGSASVTLTDGKGQRLRTSVQVTLRPGEASFDLRVTLENAHSAAVRYQFWSTAMLAPGGQNKPSEGLQFIFPASEMTVHSSGDPRMGGGGASFSWPVAGGRDVSMLSSWREYLGFFVRPAAQEGFAGVYDHVSDEGIVRIFPPDVVRGAKGFAFGWGEMAIRPDSWTDDDSGYVELHGGVTPTFSDWAELPAGQSLTWLETWYPVAGLGGILYASENGAINLHPDGDRVRVTLFTTSRLTGDLRIAAGEALLFDRTIQVGPDDVFEQVVPLPADLTAEGPFAVSLSDPADGTVYMTMSPRSLVRQ